MMRGLTGWFLAVAAVWSGGCVPSQRTPPAAPIPVTDAEGRPLWPYWPTTMEVHALSRLVMDSESGFVIVEARVEFRDRDGLPTRAVGTAWCRLHDINGQRSIGDKPGWEIRLDDFNENVARYDPVVETYLFRLNTNWTEFPIDPVLFVEFDASNGAVLTANRALRTQ